MRAVRRTQGARSRHRVRGPTPGRFGRKGAEGLGPAERISDPGRFTRAAVVLACVVLVALAAASGGCQANAPAEPPDKVSIAWSPFESTVLMWVAEDEGFFSAHGLDVELRKYDTGAASLDAAIAGDADVAIGPTEFPLVSRALKGDPVRTVGTISRSEFTYVVARKDRGIAKPSDLRGKTIGTTRGTIAEFHLGRFLELNGIAASEVRIVDLKTPASWVDAVANGEVDAVSTAQPSASAAMTRLGTNGIWWSAQGRQPLYAQVACRADWVADHPDVVERLLAALVEAEDYTAAHPAEAKSLVARRLGLDSVYIGQVWKQNEFVVSLDEALLLVMEDEARWLARSNPASQTALPDLLEVIYADGLMKVRPEAVSIIR